MSAAPSREAAAEAHTDRRADDFLAPVLFGLVAAVRDGASRTSAPDDAEAIHDYRVALRRLRTALRPARRLYGKRRTRELSAELRRFAQATSALRDEEVLREILTALDLPSRSRGELDAWLVQRARQERARRRDAIAQIAPGATRPRSRGPAPGMEAPPPPPVPSLAETLAHLERRLHRRRLHASPAGAVALAEETLAAAAADVDALLGGHVHDAPAMHALRIRYKRLRYAAEIFAPLLGDRAAAVASASARMQKRLGELHDLEQAMVRIRRARGLPAGTRAAVVRALTRARKRQRERVERDLVEERRRLHPAPEG